MPDSPSPHHSTSTPFSDYLRNLLSARGAAAELARKSGVPTSHISKICDGRTLPSVEVLDNLLRGLPFQVDRDHLALEYVKLHLPAGAKNVKVLLNDQDSPKDRLERACEALDPKTREALAVIVEAVHRAPEQGARALQGLAEIFGGKIVTNSSESVNKGSSDNLDSLNSTETASAPDTSCPPSAAKDATSPGTGPGRGSPPKKGASIVQLPIAHWRKGGGPPGSSDSKVAEGGKGNQAG